MSIVLYNDIEPIIYKYNGIIYGGYIRDMMINKYYTDSYYLAGYNKSDFYNSKIAKIYLRRLIKPNDMDIYFKCKEDVNNFIEELETYGDIIKTNNNDFTYTGIYSLIKHKQITLLTIKEPLIFDISFPYENTKDECQNLEPPFYNLDMYCNGFIMDKSGIRYSSMTGTYIDKLDINKRKKIISKIIIDIYECKTELATYGGLKIEEPYIVGRVIKMLNRKFSWNIINSPFISINNKCFICKNCNESSLIGFRINNNYYDKNCFYEKLYNCEFKRELNLKIDDEIISFV